MRQALAIILRRLGSHMACGMFTAPVKKSHSHQNRYASWQQRPLRHRNHATKNHHETRGYKGYNEYEYELSQNTLVKTFKIRTTHSHCMGRSPRCITVVRARPRTLISYSTCQKLGDQYRRDSSTLTTSVRSNLPRAKATMAKKARHLSFCHK